METILDSTLIALTGSYPGQPPRPQPAPTTELLRCIHCGFIGEKWKDVDYFNVHVGGKGEVKQIECVSVIQCWSRMDAQNK